MHGGKHFSESRGKHNNKNNTTMAQRAPAVRLRVSGIPRTNKKGLGFRYQTHGGKHFPEHSPAGRHRKLQTPEKIKKKDKS
jgi:hypothetical protein